jgi:hypothetical protein
MCVGHLNLPGIVKATFSCFGGRAFGGGWWAKARWNLLALYN